MSKRPLRVIAILTVMISMAFGMLPVSGGHWFSHSPMSAVAAQAARHVQLAMQIDDHGHVHDDGDEGEQVPGHSHGHNPADHSHETPNLPAGLAMIVPARGQSWQGQSSSLPFREAAFRVERPPRPIPYA